jgi:hypothetical protein
MKVRYFIEHSERNTRIIGKRQYFEFIKEIERKSKKGIKSIYIGGNVMNNVPNWAEKKVTVESLAEKARSERKFLKELLASTGSEIAQVKYKSAKVLRYLSEKDPEVLYSYWDHFERRLSSDNTFLRSDAMFVVVNLTAVDGKGRFEKIFNLCYKQLDDPSMIPAANLAGMSGKIALTKPNLQTKIVNRLVKIDSTSHSNECKSIIKGKAIESFSKFYGNASSANQRKILDFVKKETENSRSATKKKADKFLRKWNR